MIPSHDLFGRQECVGCEYIRDRVIRLRGYLNPKDMRISTQPEIRNAMYEQQKARLRTPIFLY